jgi:hypothetical protein
VRRIDKQRRSDEQAAVSEGAWHGGQAKEGCCS